MAYFYASANDLLAVLAQIESRLALRYTLTGHVDEPAIQSFTSGTELPTLGARLIHPDAVAGPAYLVSAAETPVRLRELPRFEGKARWAVDQLINPDTTVLSHGGMYSDSILLHGRVATASKSPTANRLQRAFDTAIKKHFARIESFYVGPEAEALLDRGVRLTIGAQSPEAYDLSR